MSDRIVVEAGCRPWTPAAGTTVVEIYNHYERPLSGLLSQDGNFYVFWCVSGPTSDSNLWAYALVEAADLETLQGADDDDFEEAFERATSADSVVVALAHRGRIILSTIVDSATHDPTVLVVDAMSAIQQVFEEGRKAAAELGVGPPAVKMQPAGVANTWTVHPRPARILRVFGGSNAGTVDSSEGDLVLQ